MRLNNKTETIAPRPQHNVTSAVAMLRSRTNKLGLFWLLPLLMLSHYTWAEADHGSDDGFTINATYLVNAESLALTLTDGKHEDQYQAIWQVIINLLPQEQLKPYINEFQVFTDGEDGDLAFVEQVDRFDLPHLWNFGIDHADFMVSNNDPAMALDAEILATILHEFAHILTMNATQLDFDTEDCRNYEIDEGCAETHSYIQLWLETFWHTDVFINHEINAYPLDGEALEDATANFYDQYQGYFVTEYAATNPLEDFAETFAVFVLSDKPQQANTVADEKIAFMHKFIGLRAIREMIRTKTDVRFDK